MAKPTASSVLNPRVSPVSDIVISDLTIYSEDDFFLEYGIRIHRNKTFDTSFISGVYVDRVTVKRAEGRAFRVYCAQDVVIQNSIATENSEIDTGYGFEIICDDGLANCPDAADETCGPKDSKWVVIRNSHAIGPKMRHGFIIQDDVRNSVIEGCWAYKNSYGAIELHARGERHNEFKNNLVEDATRDGIKIRTGAGDYNWIHGNTIRGAKVGIRVETDNNTVESNAIVDFTQSGPDQIGIMAKAGNNLVIRNNIVRDNDSPADEDYSFVGIVLSGASNEVTGNIVTGNQKGVSLEGFSADALMRDNTVDNNREYDLR